MDKPCKWNQALPSYFNLLPSTRFELSMQQNATMNVFTDDYSELGEEDNSFGSKSDNHLKEYQSFTALQYSKNKMISNIQWHPNIKGEFVFWA